MLSETKHLALGLSRIHSEILHFVQDDNIAICFSFIPNTHHRINGILRRTSHNNTEPAKVAMRARQ